MRKILFFPLVGVLAAPASGCGALCQVASAVLKVAPGLVDLVGKLLGRDDYQRALDEEADKSGAPAVEAAVRANLAEMVRPPQTRAAALLQLPPDTLRADRAELWLRRRGLKP